MIGWLHRGVGPKFVRTSIPSTVKNLPLRWDKFPLAPSTIHPSKSAIGRRRIEDWLFFLRSSSHSRKCRVVRSDHSDTAESQKAVPELLGFTRVTIIQLTACHFSAIAMIVSVCPRLSSTLA